MFSVVFVLCLFTQLVPQGNAGGLDLGNAGNVQVLLTLLVTHGGKIPENCAADKQAKWAATLQIDAQVLKAYCDGWLKNGQPPTDQIIAELKKHKAEIIDACTNKRAQSAALSGVSEADLKKGCDAVIAILNA